MTQKEISLTEDLIKGMDETELKIVVKNIPDTMLWQELIDRFYSHSHLATTIKDLAQNV